MLVHAMLRSQRLLAQALQLASPPLSHVPMPHVTWTQPHARCLQAFSHKMGWSNS